MRETSTIHYTFEDVDGYAETFNRDYFEQIVENEEKIGTVLVELVGENESIEVPLLKGYRKPYDSDITDEIGTEHYIYYEELEAENIMVRKTQEDYYQELVDRINTKEQYIDFLVECVDSELFNMNVEERMASKEFAINWQSFFKENN